MSSGTNSKTHELAMRQDGTMVWTRAPRLRLFPTDYGHAALCRAIGATCVYQSDSSSKRPVASVAFGTMTAFSQEFSTCCRRWRASKNAPCPAAGLAGGPHPPPLALRVSMWRTAPRRSIVRKRGPGEKSDAHRSSRNDDRCGGQGNHHAEQRPRRCSMNKHPSVDKGRSISASPRSDVVSCVTS